MFYFQRGGGSRDYFGRVAMLRVTRHRSCAPFPLPGTQSPARRGEVLGFPAENSSWPSAADPISFPGKRSSSNGERSECKLRLVRCVGNSPESSGAEPQNISKLDRLPFFKWCLGRGDYPCHGAAGTFCVLESIRQAPSASEKAAARV